MENLNVAVFQKMFISAAEYVISREPYLTEIDSVIGDGDHGIGMKRGCEALIRLLNEKKYQYIDDLCQAVSMELIKTMGGASGVIFGTMFFGGISCLPHEETVSAKQLAAYFMNGERSVERRGKAKPGQKTMLDALYPACVAMNEAAEVSGDVEKLFMAGYDGACKGVENSKKVRSQTGRSRNFGDKTVGLPDPGAVSTSFLFEAFCKTFKGEVEC